MGWLPFFSLSRIDDGVAARIPHAAQPSEAAVWRGGAAPLRWRRVSSTVAASWPGGAAPGEVVQLLRSSGGLVRVGQARAGDADVEGQRWLVEWL
jgi:hypothetical protein